MEEQLRAVVSALRGDHDTLAARRGALEARYAELMALGEENFSASQRAQVEELQSAANMLMSMEAELTNREEQVIAQYGREAVLAVMRSSNLMPEQAGAAEPVQQVMQEDSTADLVGPSGVRIEQIQNTRILCCKCSVAMEPNETRLCFTCLKTEANVTEGISEKNCVYYCKTCERFESKPTWLRCEWESKELLALCLKHIKKPRDARLVSAEFVWTEPHCRRIKVKVGIEREMFGATLRQYMVIEYIQAIKQCPECTKSVTPHLWVFNLQVRQRAAHKRTLLFLEQLILKANAHSKCINIVDLPDGLDFHFARKQEASSLVNFIRSHLCVKIDTVSTQLVTHDAKSNTCLNKYVQKIELCPICRDDLVFLPKRIATMLGGVPQVMLCNKITTGMHLVDPFTLRGVDMDCDKYWKNEFTSFMTRRNLSEFMVLNVEILEMSDIQTAGVAGRFLTGMMKTEEERSTVKRAWGHNSYFKLAEVEVARLSDIGHNDQRFIVRTHLGNVLSPGNIVLGYDMQRSNIQDNDEELNSVLSKLSHDIILVKKQTAQQTRNWVLKTLPKSTTATNQQKGRQQDGMADDIEALKEELELDADMRKHVAIYRNPNTGAVTDTSKIDLSEMLNDLTLEDEVF